MKLDWSRFWTLGCCNSGCLYDCSCLLSLCFACTLEQMHLYRWYRRKPRRRPFCSRSGCGRNFSTKGNSVIVFTIELFLTTASTLRWLCIWCVSRVWRMCTPYLFTTLDKLHNFVGHFVTIAWAARKLAQSWPLLVLICILLSSLLCLGVILWGSRGCPRIGTWDHIWCLALRWVIERRQWCTHLWWLRISCEFCHSRRSSSTPTISQRLYPTQVAWLEI